MPLDAIIISSYKDTTISQTSQLRLHLAGHLGTIQTIKSFIWEGKLPDDYMPDMLNWHHALKLSGLSIFSYLYGHFKCDVIDFLEYEETRFSKLMHLLPRFIIISTSFIYDKRTLCEISCKVRKLCPDTIIICGGPFVLSSYHLYQRIGDSGYDTESPKNDFLFLSDRQNPSIDYYIIANQGLDTLLLLMNSLENKTDISGIPNIAYNEEGHIKFNTVAKSTKYEYIDILWDKLPERFFNNRVASLQASNGCPYKCNFCNFVKDRRATFIRSYKDIVYDLNILQSKGIEYVRFADDNFILGKSNLNELCRMIIDMGLKIKWHSFMRMGNLLDADIELLKMAGCSEILLGLESANPDILKNMNKNIDPKIYKSIIQQLISYGINVASTFIVGYPGETKRTAQDTFDFIDSIDTAGYPGIFKWSIFPFTLLPGSPIYHSAERKKYSLTGYMQSWRHKTMNSDTAQRLIDDAYIKIRGMGPGYASDNLNDLYGLPPDKRFNFILSRFELSKHDREITLDDCNRAFKGIFI
jgi:p-methyltransferase